MRRKGNATGDRREALGLALGALGVLGFSFSLPATKLAVADLDPAVVGLGRALVAAVAAAGLLVLTRRPRPSRAQWRRLALVALGVVVGFPLLTSIALRQVDSAHGAIVVGVLPAVTALMAVLRAGERPSRGFWLAAGAGLVTVVVFAATQGATGPHPADGLLLAAVVLCALGYAEGGALARELGAWPVICWALVLAAPFLAPVVGAGVAAHGLHAGATAWLGFAYVALVSMFTAFFAWYAGLALGGVARVGQVQLAQPVLTLVWAAALLGEHVGAGTVAAALAVLASVVATQRTTVDRTGPARAAEDSAGAPRTPAQGGGTSAGAAQTTADAAATSIVPARTVSAETVRARA